MRESSFDELARRLHPHLQDAPMPVESAVTRKRQPATATREALLTLPIHSTEGRLQVNPLHHFAPMQQGHFRP